MARPAAPEAAPDQPEVAEITFQDRLPTQLDGQALGPAALVARLKLFKGIVTVLGRSSPNSPYREDFATLGQDDVYNQTDAEGFINLFGLQMKVKAMLEARAVSPAELPSPDFAAFKRD